MSPSVVENILAELVPTLEKLIQRTVEREVARATGLKTWRGAYVAGLVYGADTVIEHGGRLYRAIDATTETPGPGARGWRVHAEAR